MPCQLPRAGRGFTLIEILVVCAIVGVTLAFVVFRTGLLDGRRLGDAAESLAQRLESTRDEAIISGQLLAFSSDGKGYQFWRLDGEKKTWASLSSAGDLAARELPGGVDGLIHISRLSDGHVARVSDVLKEGDEIMVEIVEFKGNKIGLGRAK